MTITLNTPTLIFIIAEIVTLMYALTRNNNSSSGYIDLGSDRAWAVALWLILSAIAIAIFGGIYWW